MITEKRRTFTTEFSLVLLVLLVLSLFLYFNFTTVVISGNSMLPNFKSGQKVLATRAYWLVGPVRKKDVVVITDPTRPGANLIKRVLGVGGDVIDFAYVPEDWTVTRGEYRVPEGTLYVIGDNRLMSEDSRRFGPVPLANLRGKVVHLGSENGPAFVGLAVLFTVGLLLLWGLSHKVASR